MEDRKRSYLKKLLIYLLLSVTTVISFYFVYRYEVEPKTAEQSLLTIKEAYRLGDYDKVEKLAACHRNVFKQSLGDELAGIEKSAAREREAKTLFADIQKANKQGKSIEAYTKIEAYLRMYPNCANGDDVRTMAITSKKINEQALADAALARPVSGRVEVDPVQMLIVDSTSSNRLLTIAVYLPDSNKEKIMSAVRKLRLEMPAWEHEIIFLNDPDFSISKRQENEDEIIAIYLSVTRTLSIIDLNEKTTEFVKDFP